MKALKYRVDTAKQRCPYNSLGDNQAAPPELSPSSPPRCRRARYLCTKSNIIKHGSRQAIYITYIAMQYGAK